MRASEIVAILQDAPGDPEVYVSSDAEGNKINTIGFVQYEPMMIHDHAMPSGHVYQEIDVLAEEDVPEYEDEVSYGVVVWPV